MQSSMGTSRGGNVMWEIVSIFAAFVGIGVCIGWVLCELFNEMNPVKPKHKSKEVQRESY